MIKSNSKSKNSFSLNIQKTPMTVPEPSRALPDSQSFNIITNSIADIFIHPPFRNPWVSITL